MQTAEAIYDRECVTVNVADIGQKVQGQVLDRIRFRARCLGRTRHHRSCICTCDGDRDQLGHRALVIIGSINRIGDGDDIALVQEVEGLGAGVKAPRNGLTIYRNTEHSGNGAKLLIGEYCDA